jgi:hypothetical protein
MTTSENIQPQHLERHAVVYPRQSTPQQVLNHQESLRTLIPGRVKERNSGPFPRDFVTLGRSAENGHLRHRTPEADVRINVPLLPICIETGGEEEEEERDRWRSLPPLRLTLLGLILMVAIAALFLSVLVEAVRLHNISSYHAIETQKAANHRPGPPYLQTSLKDWHFRMAKDYCAAGDRKEEILAVMLKLCLTLGMVAVLGRVIHWLFRRSFLRSRE